jgi:hypothetical protein
MEDIDFQRLPNVLISDTKNATRIPVEEAPPHKREKYRRFRAYNTGLWNGPRRENTEAFRRQDNLHVYDAIASKLGMTTYQKRRGRHLIDDIHIKSLGKSVDSIAFAIAIIVANQDANNEKRYWPHQQATGNDREFARMGHDLGLDLEEQMSVVMQVKSRIDL